MARVIDVSQLQDFADGFTSANDARFTKKADLQIVKQATAETGFIASYKLMDGETQLGATMNIPKDYLVKDADVKTCTTADDPVEGLLPGDKYIDFVVNTVEGTGSESHIYIKIKDFFQPYVAGNGIDITNTTIAVKIDSANANGLSADAGGLKLGVVTASVSGVGGSNGAMLATDKEKLDGITEATDAEITAIINSLYATAGE